MGYHILRLESDPKVIGVKNGLAQVELHEKGFASREMYKKVIGFSMDKIIGRKNLKFRILILLSDMLNYWKGLFWRIL